MRRINHLRRTPIVAWIPNDLRALIPKGYGAINKTIVAALAEFFHWTPVTTEEAKNQLKLQGIAEEVKTPRRAKPA